MQTANGVFVWRYLNVPQNWAYVNSYWSWVLVIATMVPEFIYPFVCKSSAGPGAQIGCTVLTWLSETPVLLPTKSEKYANIHF